MLEISRGNLHVLNEEENWETDNDVCKDLPNNNIASGYIQAYHIFKKKGEGRQQLPYHR